MRNHEVTESQKLLRHGQIAEPGWSRKMLQTYDRKDIKASKLFNTNSATISYP